MRRSVEGHLGYDPFDDKAGLHVRCRIVQQRARLLAVVNVDDPASGRSGERKLVSTNLTCTELADAAALAIAIAIDPLLPATGPSGSLPDVVTTPASDENAESPRVPTAADRANREGGILATETPAVPLIFAMGAGGAVSYALQPSPTFCASVALAVRRGALSLALEGEWRPPSQLNYRSGSITAQLLSASLLGCGTYRSVNACVLADAGALFGSAQGYLRSASDTTAFVATGARIGWQPSLFGNWSALIYVTGLVPVVRTTLWVDPESVWTMPRFAVQSGILGFFDF